MWMQRKKQITKEEYEAIKKGEKSPSDFFSEAALVGYGAIPQMPIEQDGEYYIPYGISDSCD